jgi:UDP-N-acetylglucosamine/UDP-N-acetylgalactosamine diphosphorylase
MLNQPPIFLGGQGGIVGPLRMGFGNVVAAGSVLKEDHPEDNRLIVGETRPGGIKHFLRALYPNLPRIIENNILYLANLSALEEWYIHVRKIFLEGREFGELIHAGLLDKLSVAKKERLKRLEAMAKTAVLSESSQSERETRLRDEFGSNMNKMQGLFRSDTATDSAITTCKEAFLTALNRITQGGPGSYVETIQGLPSDVSLKGTQWLECVVAYYCRMASNAMPGLQLFKKQRRG